MSTNQSLESSEQPEFNLKHRVTGAAVLLFFGAAVLPWLLGPPSDANKAMPEILTAEASEVSEEIQGAELSIDGADVINVEETVYVSKITPLDKGKQAALEKVVTQDNRAVVTQASKDDAKAKEALAAERAKTDAKIKRDQELKAVKELELKQEQVAKDDLQKKQEADAAAQLKAKLAKEQLAKEQSLKSDNKNATTVDVGWIVQVGLFTEKDRAIAFVSELKNKGFTASSNVVDTNRGKNTGTRVWLGPFARKANAANEVKRLKAKAGKDGFIRSYP